MINHLSVNDLRLLAAAGASLEVDGARYLSDDLRLIAVGLSKGAHLKVFNSNSKSVDELRMITVGCAGQVILA